MQNWIKRVKKCVLTFLKKNIAGAGPFKNCPHSPDCSQASVSLNGSFRLAKAKESLQLQNAECSRIRSENIELEEEFNQLEEINK